MSGADTVKATALAVRAERPATAGRLVVATPWSWNPHDVWLTRIRQPREPAAESSQATLSGPPTRPRQGTALRD